jgi:hypothetical protein
MLSGFGRGLVVRPRVSRVPGLEARHWRGVLCCASHLQDRQRLVPTPSPSCADNLVKTLPARTHQCLGHVARAWRAMISQYNGVCHQYFSRYRPVWAISGLAVSWEWVLEACPAVLQTEKQLERPARAEAGWRCADGRSKMARLISKCEARDDRFQ